MPERLRRRAASGLGWMALGYAGQIVAQAVVLGILARLLDPATFGVVAATMVVVNLTMILAQSGVGQALVQRQELSEEHLRVGLTFSVLSGLALWGALVVLAPLVEGLFDIDGVAPVLRIIALVFVIRGLTIGEFLLARQLRFRALACVELGSYAIGYGVLAVALALAGHGVWAIVAGHLGQSAVRVVLLWALAPQPVRPSLAPGPLRELLSYGGGNALARLANWAARQVDNFVVGRWLGPAALGLYSQAYRLMTIPSNLVGEVADKVMFPVMASVQDDRARLRTAYLHGAGFVALLALPASIIAALLSEELILVLLGRDWLAVTAAFDVLAYGIALRVGYKLGDAVARATGAMYRRAWRQGCYAVLVLAGAVIGQAYGLAGVAAGVLAAVAVNFLLMTGLGLSLVGATWRQFAVAHVPAVTLTAVLAATVVPVVLAARGAGLPALAVIALAGVVAAADGLVFVRAAHRLPAAAFLAELLQGVSRSLDDRTGRWFVLVVGPRYAGVVHPAGMRVAADRSATDSADEAAEKRRVDVPRDG